MVEEFRTLLVRIYAAAIADFATLDMKYLPSDAAGSDNDVSIRVEATTDGKSPTIVAYRLHRNEGDDWKVYDITVDGVSLVTTYRSTFCLHHPQERYGRSDRTPEREESGVLASASARPERTDTSFGAGMHQRN